MKSVACFLCLFVALAVGRAETLRFSGAFTDHAVLQRGVPLPVSGLAGAGEKITVMLGDAKTRVTAQAVAGADGAWAITLPPQPAGGPWTLTAAGKTTVTLQDVVVGDVWFCSGQSNMAGTLKSYATPEELAALNVAGIRVFTQWNGARATPAPDVEGRWVRATPENAPVFSAVAWYFARRLHAELNVPVGVVVSAAGGTNIISWSGPEAFKANPEAADHVVKIADLQARFGTKVDDRGFEALAYNDRDAAWGELPSPGEWEKSVPALATFDGVLWARKRVSIPASWAGRDLVVRFGPIDDRDVTYFNGVQIGAMGPETPLQWQTPRLYPVPARLVRGGEAVIAVRITDKSGGGGFLGAPDAMTLAPAVALTAAEEAAGEGGVAVPAAIPLAGAWRYRVVESWPAVGEPAALYQNMVAPWIHTPVRGFLWYQGESNAGAAKQYRGLLRAMIVDWRKQWGLGDLPFIVVQLPDYGPVKEQPADSNWAELREAQAKIAAEVPATGLVVTMGLGEAANIHPKRKREVGDRVAELILGQVYGKAGVFSGPVFAGQAVDGATIRVKFTGTGGGLAAQGGGALKGFAVAGKDRVFAWADAKIDGDTVIVSSAGITQPLYVRYGWADSPTCTLANQEGYPAAPFRTDGGK